MGAQNPDKKGFWNWPKSQDQGGRKKEDQEGILPELQQSKKEYEEKLKRNKFRNELYSYSDFDNAE